VLPTHGKTPPQSPVWQCPRPAELKLQPVRPQKRPPHLSGTATETVWPGCSTHPVFASGYLSLLLDASHIVWFSLLTNVNMRLPAGAFGVVAFAAAAVFLGSACAADLDGDGRGVLLARWAVGVGDTDVPVPSATARAVSLVKASPKPAVTKKAPPPVSVASSAKKGVGVWTFNGVSTALAKSGASWYYTWSTTHGGVTTPKTAKFVPMIWGADSVNTTALAQAKSAGPYLLGFNEPDMGAQSNMSVDKALSLWPKLMSAGKVLGSPAVAYGGDTPGGWLDKFMRGAKSKGYRVDFITLHWYGGDFNATRATSQLKGYLQTVYNRYHKPIWLTEHALIDFSNGTRYPSQAQQAAFVTTSAKMLAGLPYVQRYAWFGLPAKDNEPSSGLFKSGGAPTEAGRAFQAAS
jgi:hypothetical protein